MTTTHLTLPDGALDTSSFKPFFLNHLNRVYCVKAHLQEHLPEIRSQAHFTDLMHAITETMTDVEKQVTRILLIFSILDLNLTLIFARALSG